MKENTSWKFTDELSVTFQSSVSGPGEFGLKQKRWEPFKFFLKPYFDSLFFDIILWPNSPAPLMDDWKVTDNSSVNFHDVFFFIFCYNLAKNEEKHVMEIYG